jgi:U3 small nucleolar RNA-associated protein 3
MSEDEDLSGGDEYDEDAMDVDDLVSKPTGKKKASQKKAKGKTAVQSSSSDSESQEEEETWGRSRSAYYSSNAADLESDDEEGNELEVQEAKRLQAKAREALTDNDFGFEDPIDVLADKDENV